MLYQPGLPILEVGIICDVFIKGYNLFNSNNKFQKPLNLKTDQTEVIIYTVKYFPHPKIDPLNLPEI